MDYVKSSDPEIGVVIKRHEWVEGTEIGYQRSDIGVGMGSNTLLIFDSASRLGECTNILVGADILAT